MAAQEEEEVAEEAEKDHPDHVQLEEQVEGVKTSSHCAQVLDKRREAWKSRRRSEANTSEVTRREEVKSVPTLTQHPEQATQQADNQELPHLLQALLSCRQQAAMRKLLEELLAAQRSHGETGRGKIGAKAAGLREKDFN